MTMYRKYSYLLRRFNRICVNCLSIPYRSIEHCLKKKEYTFHNVHNIQQWNFYCSGVNSCKLTLNELEKNILNLFMCVRNGRVFLNDIEQIVQAYETSDYTFTNEISLLLLKSCGELLPDVIAKERRILTRRIWNLIQNKDCQLTLEHYNTLLLAYAQNKELINPHEFLINMKVKPDETTYRCLLNVILKIESYDLIPSIISKMKNDIKSWSKETFDVVIEAYAMQNNITEAYKIIEEMQSINIKPTSETYLCFAYGFARIGDIKNIVEILEKNQPSTSDVMKIIRIISLCGHSKHIPTILKFLPVPLKEDKFSMINNTIIDLMHSERTDEALKVITELPKDVDIRDACIEYTKCFINKEIQLNASNQDILMTVRKLMHRERHPQIINEAAKVALFRGQESLALSLFEDMKEENIPVRPHYYWPLFLQARKHLDKNKAYFLISHMLSLDLLIDYETLVKYVLPLIDTKDPNVTINTLIDKGINYSIAINCVSAFLLRNNRLEDLLSLCSKLNVKLNFYETYLEHSLIEGYREKTDVLTYMSLMLQIPYAYNPPYIYILKALLNDASNSQNLEGIIHFVELLQKNNVKISKMDAKVLQLRIGTLGDITMQKKLENLLNQISAAEITVNSIDNLGDKTSLSKSVLSSYPHPKKMNSEELHAHIIELGNKNMNTRGVSRKLLQQYCQNLDIKNAERLKKNIIENQFSWTPGMSASLFHLYTNTNQLDKAEIELNELQYNFSDFPIDNVKILTYACALVKNNRLQDAFDVINNVKNVFQKIDSNRKCHQLLLAIAESEHHNRTEEMLDTLVKNKYCEVNNSLLLPLFHNYCLNNDTESMVDKFIYCVEKYKHTPCKQKILLQLIKNTDLSVPKNKNMLKSVMKCISNIEGKKAAIVHLIIVLAHVGNVSQVQNIFLTRHVQMNLLMYNMRGYKKGSELDICLTIFEAIKNLTSIQKNDLCDFILSIYKKNGNYEAAVRFLKNMEDAHIPTSHFKQNFSDILTKTREEIVQ